MFAQCGDAWLPSLPSGSSHPCPDTWSSSCGLLFPDSLLFNPRRYSQDLIRFRPNLVSLLGQFGLNLLTSLIVATQASRRGYAGLQGWILSFAGHARDHYRLEPSIDDRYTRQDNADVGH